MTGIALRVRQVCCWRVLGSGSRSSSLIAFDGGGGGRPTEAAGQRSKVRLLELCVASVFAH